MLARRLFVIRRSADPVISPHMAKWLAIALSACASVLAGCGGGSTTTATTTETVTVTATPTSNQASGHQGPNPLGKEVTFTGTGLEEAVTVFAVNQDSASDAPKPETGGHHWVGADVQLCLKQAPADGPVKADWNRWSVSDAQFGNYDSSRLTYNQFPTPEYPDGDAPVAIGDCVRGWVLFPVGDGVAITTVKYTPNSDSTPEIWSAA
jgi:hypothetical protein